MRERSRLLIGGLAHFLASRALFFGSRGDNFGALLNLLGSDSGLRIDSRNLTAAVGDLDHIDANLLKCFRRLLAFHDFRPGRVRTSLDALGNQFDVLLNLDDQILDIAGALFGRFRQSAHLVGDDGEAFAVLPGSRSFDGRIQCQQIGLVGDTRNGLDHLADRRGLTFKLLDHFPRRFLALRGGANCQNGIGDLFR